MYSAGTYPTPALYHALSWMLVFNTAALNEETFSHAVHVNVSAMYMYMFMYMKITV